LTNVAQPHLSGQGGTAGWENVGTVVVRTVNLLARPCVGDAIKPKKFNETI
jgi:hypothetical protein